MEQVADEYLASVFDAKDAPRVEPEQELRALNQPSRHYAQRKKRSTRA